MKLKTIFSIVLFVFTLIACKKNHSSTLIYDQKNLVYKDPCKGEDCAEVSIDYILFHGDDPVSEKINFKIHDFIKSSLNYNVEDTTTNPTISLAAEKFLNTYQLDKKEFPEISPYFAEISISNSYKTDEFICLEMKQYLYTGGAHGYGTTWFLNIDIETGEEITLYDLLKDEKEFTKFVEAKFRDKMEIPIDKSINSTGFWFENDLFYLPETLGFQDNNLIVLYNPYDISSYASGMIELSIPLEEVNPFLQIK